jgi:hypothetical protein
VHATNRLYLQWVEAHPGVRELLPPHRVEHHAEGKHVTHLVVEVLREGSGSGKRERGVIWGF